MADWIVYPSLAAQQSDFKDTLNTDTRRQHSKSRSGCTVCKKRRIKCDETKPACRQCVNFGRKCSFLSTVSQVLPGQTPQRLEKDHEASRDVLFSHVWDKLQSRAELCNLTDVSTQKANVEALLDHFIDCNDEWLATPLFQQLVQRHGVQLGLWSEYLLHAILAVTASHLEYLDPTKKELKFVSSFHYSLSLRLYQEKLADVQSQDIDAIFACGMIHIMMVIKNTVSDPLTDGDTLGGFNSLLVGVKSIKSFPSFHRAFHLQAQDRHVLFHELFFRCTLPDQPVENHPKKPAMMAQMANLESHIEQLVGDAVFDNTYRKPFQYLVLISEHEPNSNLVDLFLSFATQLEGRYLEALETEEPVALLLICYWFALLSTIEQWWVTKPAKILCERFYIHLLGVLPAKGQERATLLAPAAQVVGWGFTR
jgi:hypothetical protein